MQNVKPLVLATWEAFEGEVDRLFELVEKRRSQTETLVSNPLFRGLGTASWGLETTLERFTTKAFTIDDYFKTIRAIRPAAQSFTGKSWSFDPHLNLPPKSLPLHPLEVSEFMIYLRHHGFPSPLLDWTRSPYVAAFFAFESKLASKEEYVAIYAYIEQYGEGKSGSIYAVQTVGPYVTTDRRHHIQQCEYSYATKKIDDNDVYCSHEVALAKDAVGVQDVVIKYLIPRSERARVLAKLDFMNINSHSLFGDEESLMRMLAYREIEKKTCD